jgi:hypothetical protein
VESQSLSRIPFRVEDELMIASMARWMGFIGRFVMIVSAIGLFLVLLGFCFCLLMFAGSGAIIEKLGPFGEFLKENQSTLMVLAAAMCLLNALQIAAGYYLFWASRDFDNVARTNEADQDFLASGLTRLKNCAKISTTVAVFQLLVNLLAGLALTNLQKLTG